MAPALNTIPQAPADEAALLTKPSSTKTSLKGLVAGAAVASFVLGLVAATAVTSAAAPRAPAAFHSSSSFMLKSDGKCLTATSRKEKASVKGEYCEGRSTQMWEDYGSGFKLAGTELCLDGLGGSVFFDRIHKHFGLYQCKSGSQNQGFYFFNGYLSMMNKYDNYFKFIDNDDTVCVMSNGGGKLVFDDDFDVAGCDTWERVSGHPAPAPTPAPPPFGPTTFDCPWDYDRSCTSDSECTWTGAKNTCSKCHKGHGGSTRWICGPQDAPPPTPSPAGKGKCDIRYPPREQGAKSCNPKHNDADGYNYECSDNGRCQVCRKSTTSKHFNGNNWSGWCMDPVDE